MKGVGNCAHTLKLCSSLHGSPSPSHPTSLRPTRTHTAVLFMWVCLPAFGAASYIPAIVLERPLFVRRACWGPVPFNSWPCRRLWALSFLLTSAANLWCSLIPAPAARIDFSLYIAPDSQHAPCRCCLQRAQRRSVPCCNLSGRKDCGRAGCCGPAIPSVGWVNFDSECWRILDECNTLLGGWLPLPACSGCLLARLPPCSRPCVLHAPAPGLLRHLLARLLLHPDHRHR